MKKLMVGLMLISGFTSAVSAAVFPRVTNWGTHVEISVDNWESRSVFCSGSVYMTLEGGQTESQYVSLSVFPRGWQTRRIYPSGMNRISHMNHSVWCN